MGLQKKTSEDSSLMQHYRRQRQNGNDLVKLDLIIKEQFLMHTRLVGGAVVLLSDGWWFTPNAVSQVREPGCEWVFFLVSSWCLVKAAMQRGKKHCYFQCKPALIGLCTAVLKPQVWHYNHHHHVFLEPDATIFGRERGAGDRKHCHACILIDGCRGNNQSITR